ncbi:MAG: type II toxin-antitoxin system PemK/MazF family toxin [Acidobacteria bacterium]|nr:MAG: type II toxin-antitoxin system PemK/MazF family toxin [Acidobacteriota bacterium]
MSSLRPERGDVFHVKLRRGTGSEQHGDRWAVIVQANDLNMALPTVIIVPTTGRTNRRNQPTNVFLPKGAGNLPEDSLAMTHQVRVLDKCELDQFFGALPGDLLAQIDEALRRTLGLKPQNSGQQPAGA